MKHEQASAQRALDIANRLQAQLVLDVTVATAPYIGVVVAADASKGEIISAEQRSVDLSLLPLWKCLFGQRPRMSH